MFASFTKTDFLKTAKLGITAFGLKTIKSFCSCKPAQKLYAISLVLIAGFPLIVLLPNAEKNLALVITSGASMFVSTAGLSFELWCFLKFLYEKPALRALAKRAGIIVLGLVSFLAVQAARQKLYDMVGEDPNLFVRAQIALGLIYMPVVIIGLLLFCGLIALLVLTGSLLLLMPVSWFGLLFNPSEQRFLSPIFPTISRFYGMVGFLVLFSCAGESLLLLYYHPQVDGIINTIVVYTDFSMVPRTRYASLRPNSSVAFLRGDRVCVAEWLPNGKHRFYTVRRDDLK
jgi:hypothetical protein